MTDLGANFAKVHERIELACEVVGRASSGVELLAVSKRHTVDSVRAAFAAGQSTFGENRVQELVAKAGEIVDLPELRWHLIGSLQTNKVRDLLRVPQLALVHSLDRSSLADQLQRELVRLDRDQDVLMQIDATGEAQKHGCPIERAAELLAHVQERCTAVRVRGLMAMGPLQGEAKPVFERVVALRDELRDRSGLPLRTMSLGMSGDLESAIAAGSTLVRIGTALFGARN